MTAEVSHAKHHQPDMPRIALAATTVRECRVNFTSAKADVRSLTALQPQLVAGVYLVWTSPLGSSAQQRRPCSIRMDRPAFCFDIWSQIVTWLAAWLSRGRDEPVREQLLGFGCGAE